MLKEANRSFMNFLFAAPLVMSIQSVQPDIPIKATTDQDGGTQLHIIEVSGPQIIRRIADTSRYLAVGEEDSLIVLDVNDPPLPERAISHGQTYEFTGSNIIYTKNRLAIQQLAVTGEGNLEKQWEFEANPDIATMAILPDNGCIVILQDGKMIRFSADGSLLNQTEPGVTQTQSEPNIHLLPGGKFFLGKRTIELWDQEFNLLWRKQLTGPPLNLSIDANPILTSFGSLLYPVKEGVRLLNQDSSTQLIRGFSHDDSWYSQNQYQTLGSRDELVAYVNNQLLFIDWKNEPFPTIYDVHAPLNSQVLIFTGESEIIFWDNNLTITGKNLLGEVVWTYQRDTEVERTPYWDENGNIYIYGLGKTTILENAFTPIKPIKSTEPAPITSPFFYGSTETPLTVHLNWEGQSSASHYKVLRSVTNDINDASVLIDNLRATEYLDHSVVLANSYFYWLEVTGLEGMKRIFKLTEALIPEPLNNGDIAVQKRTDEQDFQIMGSELYPLKKNRLAFTGNDFVYILDEDLNLIGQSAPYPIQLRDIKFLAHKEFQMITAENETDEARIFRLADDATWELLYTAQPNTHLAGMAPMAHNSNLIVEYQNSASEQLTNYSISIYNSNWQKIRKFTDTSRSLIEIIYSDPLGVTYESDGLVHRYNFDGSHASIHPEILKSNYHITPDLRGGFWHRNSASHFSDVHYVDAYTLKPLTTLNLFQVPPQFESVLLGTDESGNCRAREIGAGGVRYHRVFSPTGEILEEKSIPGEITDSRTNSVTRDGYTLMFNQIDLNKPLVCLGSNGDVIFSRILNDTLIRSPFKSYHQHPNGHLYLTNNRDFLKVVMPGTPGILAHWDRGFTRPGNLNHRMLPEIITPGITMTPASDGDWEITLKAMAYSHEAEVEWIHVTLNGSPLISSSAWQTESVSWSEPSGTSLDIAVHVRFSNRPDPIEVLRHIVVPQLEFRISRDEPSGVSILGEVGSNLRLAAYFSYDLSNWNQSTIEYDSESEGFEIPVTGFDVNDSIFWFLDWSTRPKVQKPSIPGADFPRPDL